jgi:hypothetical protein
MTDGERSPFEAFGCCRGWSCEIASETSEARHLDRKHSRFTSEGIYLGLASVLND